jgi:hypothetical protein
MPLAMRLQHDFQPDFLRILTTKDQLTSNAGLQLLMEAFDQSPWKDQFQACLPERVSPRSKGAYRLGLTQVASFVKGHDCIEDLDKFRKDPALGSMLKGEACAPRTMIDFLKDFTSDHIQRFNDFLPMQSKSIRLQLERMLKKEFKPSLSPHLFIDSTPHEQSGTKMEGLAYNYNDQWCLDSQIIYDELGLCWNFRLRPGNTKSGVGASEQIRQAFSSYKFSDEKYLSADSAYCYQEVIKTCLSLGVRFTLTANDATTLWKDHIPEIPSWEPWEYSQEQKEWALESEVELPQVELGRFYWQPSWSESLRLPVVVKRTKATGQLELGQGEWDYYGVVTNLPLIDWTLQEVMSHHNKRGNAENFIKEGKYGYDLKHFPCRELLANEAFGVFALVAHNLLRWAAIHDDPRRPKFAKRFRDKFINIPGKIVSHARLLAMRIPEYFIEEVNRLRMALGLKPCLPIPTG